jgi:hypothetical protein
MSTQEPQLLLDLVEWIFNPFFLGARAVILRADIVDSLHKCTNHVQIHPKPHNDAMKQWVYYTTHLLFSRTQGRLRMYATGL